MLRALVIVALTALGKPDPDLARYVEARGFGVIESTEVVSDFLDRSEGINPQVLTVQFTYFSGLQAWAPILIPTLFFVLGNLAAVLVRTVADRVSRRLAGRVQFGPPGSAPRGRQTGVILSRDTLARIVPGATTHAEVLQLCGPDAQQVEKLPASGRRTLVYRGRRVVPQGMGDVRLADDRPSLERRAPRAGDRAGSRRRHRRQGPRPPLAAGPLRGHLSR